MDDHTIFIRRKTRVNALVLFLSVVNIKPVFFLPRYVPEGDGTREICSIELQGWGFQKGHIPLLFLYLRSRTILLEGTWETLALLQRKRKEETKKVKHALLKSSRNTYSKMEEEYLPHV